MYLMYRLMCFVWLVAPTLSLLNLVTADTAHLQLPLLLHRDLGLEAGHGVPGLTGAGRPPRHTGKLVSVCLGESDLLVMREHQARDAVLDVELAGRSEETEQEWTGIVIHLKLNNSK